MESLAINPEPGGPGIDSNPERCCPHCKRKLTLREITIMLHGSGWEQYARVKTANGTVALVEAGLIDPTQVEVLD
jgi:hypothetical protein